MDMVYRIWRLQKSDMLEYGRGTVSDNTVMVIQIMDVNRDNGCQRNKMK